MERIMLYDYLKQNYKEAVPIFFGDIHFDHISKPVLNRMFKQLCDEGKLVKYDTGIYYIPKKSRLMGNIGPNADIVARYKYIERQGQINGYYSGNTLANKMGITTQVPHQVEITSNHMAARVREIELGSRKFIIRHPVVPVTNENAAVLQMLDLLKNLDQYNDGSYQEAAERFHDYIISHRIRKAEVDKFIRKFPVSVFKNYYELGLDHVLA